MSFSFAALFVNYNIRIQYIYGKHDEPEAQLPDTVSNQSSQVFWDIELRRPQTSNGLVERQSTE